MESRDDMLARHQRELSELESRWWEEWFTEDPIANWSAVRRNDQYTMDWIKNNLSTIIRKREKVGIEIRNTCDGFLVASWKDTKGFTHNYHTQSGIDLLIKLAGRTLAPGESVEL